MKKQEKKKNNWQYWAICLVFCVVLGVIATIVANSMLGTVTTTGGYPEAVTAASLVCENTGLAYPTFVYDNSNKKETKITAIFSDNNEIKSISLIHSLYYSDSDSITASGAHNHAAMNKSFANSGLKIADAYNAKYAKMENRMQMNLYTTASELDDIAKKYFLIDDYGESLEDYKNIYTKQGFNCKIIKD